MCKPWRNAWKGILQEGQAMKKLCKWGEQKAAQKLKGQMLQLDLNYRCASLLWTALFVLPGTARGVSVFLLLWSTEIKELPLPKWTVMLVLSILPFQQGRPSPVNTDTILSLWTSRSGWFSTFIYDWAFVQVTSVLLILLITADGTAFQQQPEPLLTWKADGAVVFIDWEAWTRSEQETDQVPQPSFGNSCQFLGTMAGTTFIAIFLHKNYAKKSVKFEFQGPEAAYLHDCVQYLHYKSKLTLLLLCIKTPCSSKQCCLFISLLITEA